MLNSSPKNRRAWSLVELIVVLTILGIMVTMTSPSFQRSLEQTHANAAAANLRAIWTAQKLYWLEHHSYATTFADLGTLVDPSILTSNHQYLYSILTADADSLVVVATRVGSTRWSGVITISESGAIAGSIHASGVAPITPGFL